MANRAPGSRVVQAHEVIGQERHLPPRPGFFFESVENAERSLHPFGQFRIDWQALDLRDA